MSQLETIDSQTYCPRWDLSDGRYVLADTAIDGGGVRVMAWVVDPLSPDLRARIEQDRDPSHMSAVVDGRVLTCVACGEAEVSAIVGADHPAIVASREMTRLIQRGYAIEALAPDGAALEWPAGLLPPSLRCAAA